MDACLLGLENVVVLESLHCIVVDDDVGVKEIILWANPRTMNEEELASAW
jgi:hypothetical protein